MKLLNSSTNKLVDIVDKKITIYNCGPTVYNHVHIGNVRPLVIFDVLYRFLLNQNKEVFYIQNITDVDDKIIKAAADNGISEKELTTKYISAYLDVLSLLNIKKIMMPKVSDHINEIINFIEALIKKGAAYVVDGDVYFNVSMINDYGHVSHQKPDNLINGARKENMSNKKSPLDFALWKKTTQGINWDSPWSKGRPGWHTECCALINKYVGDHVTIHGGGIDLKFPHHENENAQNKALFNKDIANIWVHVGHINVDGSKMSKSLNNFILVKDLIKNNNANGLRWFFYKAKYEQPVNFSNELLEEANKEIKSVIKALSIAKTYIIANDTLINQNLELNQVFINALSDDLNLPNAITILLKQIKTLNTVVRAKDFVEANKICLIIEKELDILGIKFDSQKHTSLINTIKKWKQAVDAKDYSKADELRLVLVKEGLL